MTPLELTNFRFTWYSGRHTKATDLLENGASTGAVASLLGHRDPTVVLKLYGRHIEQHREHLRELIETGDQRGLIEKTDQPPQPPERTSGPPWLPSRTKRSRHENPEGACGASSGRCSG